MEKIEWEAIKVRGKFYKLLSLPYIRRMPETLLNQARRQTTYMNTTITKSFLVVQAS